MHRRCYITGKDKEKNIEKDNRKKENEVEETDE